MFQAVLDRLQSLPAPLAAAILVLFSALENVFPPVPADVAVVLGAFLARRGLMSPVLLGVICWLGNTASAAGLYYGARARGHGLFESRWGRIVMPADAEAILRDSLARHGAWGIFLTRFLPAVRSAVLPMAGLLGVSPLRALGPAALASALWYVVLVAIGAAVADTWARAEELVTLLSRGLGALAGGAILLFAWWIRARVRARRQSAGEGDGRGVGSGDGSATGTWKR